MDNEKVAMRVSKNSILVNVILAVGKLIAGVLGKSAAMVSDAVHSASDVFSTIVVMIGVKIAGKESDHDHQYGHERLESVAALILAIVLAATGCGIGYSGLQAIMNQRILFLYLLRCTSLFVILQVKYQEQVLRIAVTILI